MITFRSEASGLTEAAVERIGADRMLGIPMRAGSRSLNLANAVSVVVYDVWRRNGFPGAADSGPIAEAPGQPPF